MLGAGIPAFILGRVLWPDAAGAPTPPAAVLPVFISISALEALLFGVGIAFLVFGRRWLPSDGSKLAAASFLAIAWSLLSWWPHDNFHRVTHDFYGLAAIEVGFHVTLIVSILIIAWYFVRTLRDRDPQS
ncbi:MAG TPA: hypothetical protein VIO84_09015 [Candidatus Dormibacteraeota bacterium]